MEPGRLFTRPFLLVFVANLLQGLAFNLFLHFPGYLKQLGADELEIGFISALTAVAAIALRPPIGRAMDRRGRRGVILAGGVLNVLVVGLYLTVDRVGPWLYVVRIGHGLAEALLFSSLFTYAADCVPAARRTQGLALFGVSGMLPIALGGAIGDFLLSVSDYAAIFLLSEGLAVVSLLFSLPLRDQPRPAHDADGPALGITAALTQRDLLPLWWIGTIFSIALTAFFVFIKTFVDETGVGSVGGFFAAYTASALVLRVFFGWVPDRVGPKRVLLPALLALGLGFLSLAVARGPAGVLAAGLLCGFGHGYTFPILFGLVVGRAPEANRGAAMAVFTALFDVGVLLGGPAFGAVIEWGGYARMFVTGAAVTLLGTAVFFTWDRRAVRAGWFGAVALLVACAAPGPLEAELEPHAGALARHRGHRLAEIHPYVWPREGELWLLLCRWPSGATLRVSLADDASPEEARALDDALTAWRNTRLGVRMERAGAGGEGEIHVRFRDPGGEESRHSVSGSTAADCAAQPTGARLVAAEVVVARAAAGDALGRTRPLDPDELTGTLVHELGHALGFQGHAFAGTVMTRERDAARRTGRRARSGAVPEDATLAALYALPEGLVLARLPTRRARTLDVDRFGELARADALAGPWLRVGDRTARIFWSGAEGAEYGFVLVNLSETLRSPERALWIAEEATRARLDRAEALRR